MSTDCKQDVRIARLEQVGDRIGVFGGVYSNHHALEALREEGKSLGVDTWICLGDLGAFGPHPDRVFPHLEDMGAWTLRGNYDDSIGRGLADCQCGYTDPRDNHFAAISYRYTLEHTSPEHRAWLRELPDQVRFRMGGREIAACHGSPRRMNEFIWESNSSTAFLQRLRTGAEAEIILATHTGIPWTRDLPDGGRWINVGALGRPVNDGRTETSYLLLTDGPKGVQAEIRRLRYDYEALAREMEAEDLPGEFVETIRTGWWTTCLEVLPAKERLRGRF